MKEFIRQRHWFGWWWASICSKHLHYDKNCGQCNAGGWTRTNHYRLFGKSKYSCVVEGSFKKCKLIK